MICMAVHSFVPYYHLNDVDYKMFVEKSLINCLNSSYRLSNKKYISIINSEMFGYYCCHHHISYNLSCEA